MDGGRASGRADGRVGGRAGGRAGGGRRAAGERAGGPAVRNGNDTCAGRATAVIVVQKETPLLRVSFMTRVLLRSSRVRAPIFSPLVHRRRRRRRPSLRFVASSHRVSHLRRVSFTSVCLSVRPSIHPAVCTSVRPSVHSSVCLYVRPPVRPFIRLSVRPSVRPSIHPSVCTSVRPSIRRTAAGRNQIIQAHYFITMLSTSRK